MENYSIAWSITTNLRSMICMNNEKEPTVSASTMEDLVVRAFLSTKMRLNIHESILRRYTKRASLPALERKKYRKGMN